MKVLAIDYGASKIGLAISDETGNVTARLPVLFASNEDQQIRGLHMIIKENQPTIVVVGISSQLDGQPSEVGLETKKFIEQLKEYLSKKADVNIPKFLEWDETYSSKNAERDKSKKYKHSNSDSEAARLVLQEFLDSPDGLIQYTKN